MAEPGATSGPHPPDAPEAKAERQSTFITTRFERWALPRLAAAMPRWVMPDHLTAIGVLGATVITVGYGLSNQSVHWLWLSNLGLLIHWFGDSLDGTLARVRKTERPRYGFYLDHLTDAYSTTVIGLGLGFSPFMLLAVGLAIVIAYLILSINVYLETHVFGKFRYGYGVTGPTEARIILFGLNVLALTIGPLPFHIIGRGVTVFDILGTAAALSMGAMLMRRVTRNLGELARAEPAGRVKP